MIAWIIVAAVIGALLVTLGLVFLVWLTRRNGSAVDPSLDIETWPAVSDGRHNSNSHMILWRDEFWLIHASSPYHFATPKCKLVLWRSKDARSWTKVQEFNIPGEDIRDPKLASIGGKLHLYVLKSIDINPEPYATAHTWSEDGESWAPLEDMYKHEGWLFWAPRTADGLTWYVPAYWYEHGKSMLLRTENGTDFETLSLIHNGRSGKCNDRNDETDIGFLGDGTMISTQRLEYSEHINGDRRACTNITLSKPPYTSWQEIGRDYTTRLDGPALFEINGRVYALGRFNPYRPRGPFRHFGSVFAKKRTSLFEVTQKGLIYLSDVPSAGDTSYGAVVMKEGDIFACYYTSRVTKDWPWIVGMVSASEIRLVRLQAAKLEALATRRRAEYEKDGFITLIPSQGGPAGCTRGGAVIQ